MKKQTNTKHVECVVHSMGYKSQHTIMKFTVLHAILSMFAHLMNACTS